MTRLYTEPGGGGGGMEGLAAGGARDDRREPRLREAGRRGCAATIRSPPSPAPDSSATPVPSPPPAPAPFAPALHNKAAGWENINLGMFCNLAARGVATYNGTLLLLRCYGVRTMFVSCLFLRLVVVVVVVVVVAAAAAVVVQIGGAHVCSPATKINISKVTKWRRAKIRRRGQHWARTTGVPRRGGWGWGREGGRRRSVDTFLPAHVILSAY